MIGLPDVNVLVAMAWPNHVHHDRARRWFEESHRQGWATCPLTESGFVRVSSNRKVTPAARRPEEAIRLLRELTALAGHAFWTDDTSIEAVRFVVLDSETTGLNPRVDRLITIGAVAVQNSEIVVEDSFDALVKIDRNTEAVTVHGVTRDQSRRGVDEDAGHAGVAAAFNQQRGAPAAVLGIVRVADAPAERRPGNATGRAAAEDRDRQRHPAGQAWAGAASAALGAPASRRGTLENSRKKLSVVCRATSSNEMPRVSASTLAVSTT